MDYESMESNEVDETTAESSSAQETNTESSMSEEDASGESQAQTTESSGEETDEYASELERVKAEYGEKLEKAEKKIVKLKQAKESGFDPEHLAEEVWKRIDGRLAEREVKSREQAYAKLIQSVSSSPSEAKLIKFHLENSIKPTGDEEADIKRAKLLANEQKILKTNRELAETLRVRSTVGSAPNFSGTKISSPEAPILSAEEKKLIQWAERVTGKKAKLT